MIELLAYFVLAYFFYVVAAMVYFLAKTRGDNYFSLPLSERKKLIAQLKGHGLVMRPLFQALAKIHRPGTPPLMVYEGITGPKFMSNKKSYAATKNYSPGPEDIFIATQMKCGTTWMQQIVFEILHHGEGDLSDQGYRHMYALSPWIETDPNASVSFKGAPLVSESQKRIIKTHMPAQLCPYSDRAKYIYVTRHPVSCFSSCVDQVELMAGPLAPSRKDLLSWYCSDEMWWSSWPDHVEGWWQRSEKNDNVLFIHYEVMKNDLVGVVAVVAKFLGVSLEANELKKILHKSSFAYMKEYEAHFEMMAPNIFSVSGSNGGFINAGSTDRYKDTSNVEAETIMQFCHERLDNGHYPFADFYPGASAVNLEAMGSAVEPVVSASL